MGLPNTECCRKTSVVQTVKILFSYWRRYRLTFNRSGLVGGRAEQDAQERSPESLTTDFLTALQSHLMYTLGQKLGASILSTIPIEYCLTVPAIWSEVAKEKTLAASRAAGLNPNGSIMLVSEPVSIKICAR